MEERTQRLLELHIVLRKLEDATSSALGRARVRALQPVTQRAAAHAMLMETSEARRFIESAPPLAFGGVEDIASYLQMARIGSLLEARSLLAVAALAAAARRLREAVLRTPKDELPLLHRYAGAIVPQSPLETAIFDAIDENSGEVKDEASLRLRKARRNMRQTQSDIQTRLRGMLSDSSIQPLLQDAFVTVRDGRYCLPVKADCRGRMPGIVHDRSGSGGAYFIEPQAVVDMNNRLRDLALEEREAIAEVLAALTAQVAEQCGPLAAAQEAVGQLDFAFAKGRLSLSMAALEPVLEDPALRSGYCLLQARHPLVKECIANDIHLGADSAAGEAEEGARGVDFDVLLITGPNTGGKTVVLKTLGLLTLMAACGLHLPCGAGSWLALPGAIYADIGDEQSIEQSLSTFSSHMKQIIAILQNARAGDLVLFDEIGAGTDPDEGAALAKAVLRALQRRGAHVVATTHYGELKQFALSAARFENSSVEFDARSLRPTFHLRIGIPGQSNALDIAARLGMPQELVQRARRYLGRDRAESEAATQRLEETQRVLEQQTERAREERDEVAQLRHEYEAKIEKLRAMMEAEREAAHREAEELLRRTQDEADAILRELRGAPKESRQTEDARRRLRTLREHTVATVPRAIEQTSSRALQGGGAVPREPLDRAGFPAVGSVVRVRSLDKDGVLLTPPDDSDRVNVRVGAMKLQLDGRDIEPLKTGGPSIGGVAAIRLRKAVTVPEEINLIGKSVDEALHELDKYLDDAILAEAGKVRVIHGRGTGALRAAIHRHLRAHRGVREYILAPANEGGEGATVVDL